MALSRMGALVESLRELKMEGREVMLVSSGAVGLGRVQLGLTKEQVSNPENFIDKQACAAAGQEMLMSMYHMMFNRMGVRASQVLITQADLLERHRYMFLTDTLDKLTQLGTIPIINENDVVTGGSKGPQVFEDNDNLSAILASGAAADGLALLTDVEAVFTKPPNEPGAQRIKVCTFSNVVSMLAFYSKCTGALTFENLFQVWDESSEVILGEKSGMLCVYLCVGVGVGVGGCGPRDAGASAARLRSTVWGVSSKIEIFFAFFSN
jgi:glutamate 5-kinase